MKTYKLLKYQDKGKGTMELKSEVPDFKKNKTDNTFIGQFIEEKNFNWNQILQKQFWLYCAGKRLIQTQRHQMKKMEPQKKR